MRFHRFVVLLVSLAVVLTLLPVTALAQTEPPKLTLWTNYPSQTIGLDETVTLTLKLRSTVPAQIVQLQALDVPTGWTVSFRGAGRIVQSVFVDTNADANVDLRVELPADVQPGTYRFTVEARGQEVQARLPVELTVREKVPARLTMETKDLLTIKGAPNTTFRWNVTLKNEGDEDVSVNLTAAAPSGFEVKFRYSAQDVSTLPLEANGSKSVSVEAKAYIEPPAGVYPITIRAQSGELSASLDVAAEVTGQPNLSITGVDGRLSGRATAGRETALKLVVRNTGTAPARGIEMGSSTPSGWTVTFEPQRITEIPVDQQVEVTAKVRPADKALAGDYMLTFRATPEGSGNVTADFRITVTTSTLWGMVGVALIAVAVLAVALVVARFGRR